MKTFADRAIEFYSSLSIDTKLPAGISILDPYVDTEVQNIIQSFFRKFYDDARERIILFGINPGRFGAGVTGIFRNSIRRKGFLKKSLDSHILVG